jgi:transcriptional regulator GlxA family with amidase domain
LTIRVHSYIDEISFADAVLFASGPGIRKLCNDENYLKRLKIDPSKQLVGSMCSGSLILGALGLLNGKKATTYLTAKRELEKFNVYVVEESFVVEGNIATAAGCLAAQNLVGWFIERLLSKKVRDAVLNLIHPVGQGLSLNK